MRNVWVGGLIVLLTLAVAASVWAWPRPEGRWFRAGLQKMSQMALSRGRQAAITVRRQVETAEESIGFRRTSPRPPVPVLAVTEPRQGPQPGQGVTLEREVAPPPVPPIQLARTQPAGGSDQGAGAPSSAGARPAPVQQPERGAIYTASSPRVVPPTLLAPRAAASFVGTAGSDQARPQAELVISATGEVESVKLLAGTTTALAGMTVSSIKAWRFSPANLDGQPVRYRMRVAIPRQ